MLTWLLTLITTPAASTPWSFWCSRRNAFSASRFPVSLSAAVVWNLALLFCLFNAWTGESAHWYNGSWRKTSKMVTRDSLWFLRTRIVSSQHLRNTPSTPDTPIASTKSLVRRKGTNSGVRRIFPCSNATPRSMWTTSADDLSIRILDTCLSPSPTM